MRAARAEIRRLAHRAPSSTTHEMTPATRGMLEIVAIGCGLAAVGAAFVWSRRRALRGWHLAVPAALLLLTVPPAFAFVEDIRSHAGGESAAWGRLGELIILLGLLPVICVAAGALVAAATALAVYGLASPEALAAARREPWYAKLSRPRSRADTLTRLYVSLGSLVLVGILWLLGVRPGN